MVRRGMLPLLSKGRLDSFDRYDNHDGENDRRPPCLGASSQGETRSVPSNLAQNRAAFDELLSRAATFVGSGNHRRAAVYAQAAGDFALFNHPGFFASTALETAVQAIADAVRPDRQRPSTPDQGGVRRVLHVLTQAYPTGGHTRLVGNWIRLDDRSMHRVVVTAQARRPFPTTLTRATAAAIQFLDSNGEDLLSRAAALRGLASSADVVVLHTHPYDIVPSLAFAGQRVHAPVVTMNHSDHTYWTGTSTSHVVANMRDSGQQLSVARRGVEVDRCAVLPIPLLPRQRERSRLDAKRALGLPTESWILLTVAAPYKYRALRGLSLIELVEPWLRSHPRALLLAIGPSSANEAWSRAAMETGGRIRALGLLAEIGPYLDAADAYLDSYPFASLTSLLQAGMAGLPLLAHAGMCVAAPTLCSDSPGLDLVLRRAATNADYRDSLTNLYEDEAIRRNVDDERTRAAITDKHSGSGWRDACERVYRLALHAAGSRPSPLRVEPSDSALDSLLCALEVGDGIPRGTVGSLTRQLPNMSSPQRMQTWVALRRKGTRLPLRKLLSPRTRARILRLRTAMRREVSQPPPNG